MRIASALIDLVLGLILMWLAGLAMMDMPAAVARYSQEREDLWILSTLVPRLLFVGSAAALAGLVLLRGRGFARISARTTSGVVLAGGLVLLPAASLGFIVAGDPSTAELRLMLIPAGVLVWSYVLMRSFLRPHRFTLPRSDEPPL